MNETRVELAPPTTDADDGPTHVVCCEDAIGVVALCGTNVADLPWHAGPEHQDCVVCIDLEQFGHCPRHGRCTG